ncbi:hypothetical protein [Actinoallomurus soli]|nr:hypothetical protein [Actinoallomurus soli]
MAGTAAVLSAYSRIRPDPLTAAFADLLSRQVRTDAGLIRPARR